MTDETSESPQVSPPKGSRPAPEPNREGAACWHRPSATVIDIKRTMMFAGSGADLSGRSTS